MYWLVTLTFFSECVEVKTVSPTHLRLTATTTKYAFYALHGLHEISIKLTRRRRYNSAEVFVFRFVEFAKRFNDGIPSVDALKNLHTHTHTHAADRISIAERMRHLMWRYRCHASV